jgi:O-antigen ligase
VNTNSIEEFNANTRQAHTHGIDRLILETIICSCLFAFIFLTPFPHMTFAKGFFLYGGFLTFLLVLIQKRLTINDIQKVPLIKLLFVFALWAFLGLFLSIDVGNSMHDFHTYLVRYMFFYVMLVLILQRKDRMEILGKLIILSVFLISIYLLYKHFFIDKHSIQIKLRTDLPEMPVNWVGFLLVSAEALAVKFLFEPASIKNKRKVQLLMVLSLAVFLLLTIITQSRATSIGFFIVFLSGFFFKNWKIGVVLLMLLLIIFSFTPLKKRFRSTNFLNAPRMLLLFSSIEIVKQYPLFGIGYGFEGFNNKELDDLKKNSQKKVTHIGSPHNIFASITVRTGIIGGVIFLMLFGVHVRNTWRVARDKLNKPNQFWGVTTLSAFCGIIFIAAVEPEGNHLFHTIFFTFLGMGSALSMQRNQPNDA